MNAPQREPAKIDSGFSFGGFVALMASLMALSGLSIDSMLGALPAIGHALGVARQNDWQWVIAIYVIGFGCAQLIYGPLADRYGRKPLLTISTLLVSVCAVVAGCSTSFTMLLAARFLQGVAAAGGRVLVVSIVRDCYSGRQMARVMSLAFIIFMIVPVLAPTIGQLIMAFAGWRAIFFALAAYSLLLSIIAGGKLKETLHSEFRRPISPASMIQAVRVVLSQRASLGYMLAGMVIYGALLAFINTIGQVSADTFQRPRLFAAIFAVGALSMGIAAFINARIVERYGTRRVSHTALILFIAVTALHAAIAAAGKDTIVGFTLMQAVMLFAFGLMSSNFNSMAMEPVGAIAGTASSVQGFVSTCGGAAVALVIGQAYDGSTKPLAVGFFAVGILALFAVLWTERGRLFRPHQPASHAA